ncbi:MAG: hypothetical protein A2270_08280 [Elusimicrobia bacterium RIFOXYA12_FULL_51_18]|nr:MAG: hypothetical protein A2270_08280 [Elusimicrobia bacterium RIFOXYA12_FULL_51_18]OGS28867.1 MAG: hypothetical protein A2218_09370 [Elusimicrobia bacterium RIFOXYA2_FULL_53_38]
MPFLKLKKPLHGLKELRDFDPGLSDLSALLIGAKPVLYTDFSSDSWPYIKGLCEAFKLKYVMPEAIYGKQGFKAIPKSGKRMLLIGKTLPPLKEAAKSWYRSPTDPAWGVLLGYPECCVKAYINWRSVADTIDLVNHTFANTTKQRRLFFGLNNIFNYFSRLTGRPADMAAFASIRAANTGLDLSTLQVISWHPCAYDCRHSIELAKNIFSFLEEYLPGRAAELKKHLARPILFRDKYEYAPLEGTAKNGKARYSAIAAPKSLLPGAIVKKITAGNVLSAGKKGLSVFRGIKRIHEITSASPFSLLNFTVK